MGASLDVAGSPAVVAGGAPRRPSDRNRDVSTRDGVAEQTAVIVLDGGCLTRQLPATRSRFAGSAAAATRQQLYQLRFVSERIMAKCDDRATRRAVRRTKAAARNPECGCSWLAVAKIS